MTNFEGKPILPDDELKAEFAALFPHGWRGADVLAELAPGGWANSPLAAIFHPSPEQLYDETLRVRRNLAALPRRPDAPPLEPTPEPTLDEFRATHDTGPVEPERECQELVGLCLWDVFSDNHEVFAADGRLLDLGSARSSGGFLADLLNAQGGPPPAARPDAEEMGAMIDKLIPREQGNPEIDAFYAEMRKEMFGDGGYTYLDFYMGPRMAADRADLTPVYAMIFRRLRARGMDWVYHFPKIGLVDFRPLKKQLDAKERAGRGEPEFAGYDPSAAFEEAEEDRRHEEEVAEMRESLEEGNREAVAAAREAEPPAVVRAYETVYGRWPEGWPPE